MDNMSLQKLQDALAKNQNIGIAVGKNPTIDTMAAALSLYLSLQAMNKKAAIVSASEPLVEHSSLVGINKVKNSFEGDGGDLVVAFPYREGEIEKVSYTIESGYLNIVVKAGDQGLNFNEQDVRFKRGGGGQPTLLFVVGTPTLSDLNGLFDPEALRGTSIVNIDVNPANQGYGDIQFIDTKYSSVSELLSNMLIDMRIEPDVDTAQNLLNGISSATNNFQDPQAGFTAFEMAGYLMKRGAIRGGMPSARRGMPQRDSRPQPQQSQPAQPYMPRPQMPRQQQPMPMPQPQPQPAQDNYAPRSNFPRANQSRGVQDIQDELSQMAPAPAPRHDYTQRQDPFARQDNAPRQDFGQRQDNTQRQDNAQQGQDQPRRDRGSDRKPPSDWLTPKVYKGSSNV